MSDLAQRHPAPDGTAIALPEDQILERLHLVPEWTVTDGKIMRDVRVRNFKAALVLVNQVGEVAEQENHHPDISIHSWNHVRLELYTHTVQGLSDNDFIMAAKFDQLLSSG
ncbi:MAG: 4a-hydroxytetrahydrobiopterin dehydratase [Chloroflexota bacterium]